MFRTPLETKVPLRKHALLRLHYHICIYCRRYRTQINAVHDKVAASPEDSSKFVKKSLSVMGKQLLEEAIEESRNKESSE